ncbi:molybdopterin molybdotransferase MoeA [Cereibacter changlensis]|uniref:molybdopterin molybdotransferase MoeA n=1 Tax=Cereibacter changlensis TaxID=402884 RepID=UPI0040349CB5
MISVEEALERALALVSPLEAETVALAEACGRFMCAPAVARRDQPPFAASAMDGYALAGDPVAGDRFTLIGEAGAGHAFTGRVGPGEAVRIFTGAPLPAGADRVVIQENVEAEGAAIRLTEASDGRNIRPAGQDFRAGDSLSPRRLRPNDLALLAAMNIAEVPVTRRPVVALVATGDELVMPGETPRDDQIIASNSFTLKALAEAEGAEVRLLPIARDTEAELRTVLEMAAGADIVVTIGGASVGDHDLVGKVAGEMGLERAFYKIAMRPGKPLIAGRLNGRPMLGLPGNPVSSIVCAHLFLLPMLRVMLGLPAAAAPHRRARLAEPLPANGPRAHYMRAKLAETDGLPQIAAFPRQDSALLRELSEADALLLRPPGDPARESGEMVRYIPL